MKTKHFLVGQVSTLCKDDIPNVSRVGYLPVIDVSPTEYSTINAILKSNDIADTLQLIYVTLVYDEAVYSKVYSFLNHILSFKFSKQTTRELEHPENPYLHKFLSVTIKSSALKAPFYPCLFRYSMSVGRIVFFTTVLSFDWENSTPLCRPCLRSPKFFKMEI